MLFTVAALRTSDAGAMDATDWFANRRDQPKLKERQSLFSGVFGGPVLPNRMFFFASYEGVRLKQPEDDLGICADSRPTCAGLPRYATYLNAFPLPNGPTENRSPPPRSA